MSIMTTLPVLCRHCGEEIEKDTDGVWVDVRFSNEGGEGDYCAMSAYATHLPEKIETAD
jgi:hypothetical protein